MLLLFYDLDEEHCAMIESQDEGGSAEMLPSNGAPSRSNPKKHAALGAYQGDCRTSARPGSRGIFDRYLAPRSRGFEPLRSRALVGTAPTGSNPILPLLRTSCRLIG